MGKDEKLELILGMNITPGVKIYITAMYCYDDAMTVKNMNDYLNKNLTYQNLENALSELIEMGIVIKTTKNVNGTKRKAFKLDLDKIREADDE